MIQKQVTFSKIKNRINWVAASEKTSKYFFALEKPHCKTPICRIKINDEIIEDQEKVLDELKMFYQKLFEKNMNVDINGFLEGLELQKVSEENKLIMDEPLKLEELEIAIKQMALSKCPGLDGFNVNFYLTF